jgi:hypothetical protein
LSVGFVSDGYTGQMAPLLQLESLIESNGLYVAQGSRVPNGVAAFEDACIHKKGIFYAVGRFKARLLTRVGRRQAAQPFQPILR